MVAPKVAMRFLRGRMARQPLNPDSTVAPCSTPCPGALSGWHSRGASRSHGFVPQLKSLRATWELVLPEEMQARKMTSSAALH